ncbi:MAG: integration host factor subunit alpha [Gammaproteobacteria bacterium]|jgi:integration host factor subunit alpha|nr:integration host factor subunit alpha [Gammaproteobacteria bacterium]HJL96228.1 integration host factor subunit alpha [SAR86 cluster bacterium]HJM58955.1 integration host factor subunit alpha [SAR86 cluster bacterium]|tara:strand:+ start:2212 stop:2508 length:297 start_codon:yes stop_codon:yes gene_type:complete
MDKTITKADIVEHLHNQLGLNKTESKQLIENFFEEIKKSLEKNEEVKLSGFGNFELINKKSRPGRNPKTGDPVTISARRVVTFKAGNKLRKRISSSNG